MTQVFLTVLDMSLKASYVILTVCLIRWVLGLFAYPRRYSYLLWGIVLLRLLLPVSVTSSLSRLPDPFSESLSAKWADGYVESTHTYYEYTGLYDNALEHGNRPATDSFGHRYVTTGEDRVSPPKTMESELLPVLTPLWAAGIAVMLLWNGGAMLRLRKRLDEAVPAEGHVFLSDQIDTAFVLGIVNPRIYLPANLTPTEQTHILRHEQYHIRCRDHRMKLLAFCLLCVHWFNPLVWLAYVLAMRDMELRCDEAVTASLSQSERADYAQTLLNLTAGHKRFHAAPVAFGEGDTAQRIRHVFRFRTPPKWVRVLAVCLVAFTAVTLLTDPKPPITKKFGPSMYGYERVAYADYADSRLDLPPGLFCLTTDNLFWVRNAHQGWDELGPADLFPVTADEINAMMPYRLAQADPPPVPKVTDSKIVRFTDDSGQHLFYLLTRHKDGSRYIAYGESATEFYEPNRMTIKVLYPVTSGVGKTSSNTPFYQRCLVSMLDDAVDVFSTYHAGDGWQIVGFRTGIPKTDYGWALFRVQDNMVTFTGQMELFENAADHNNGILLSSPAVCSETGDITDKTAFDVVLIANPQVAELELGLKENDRITHKVYPELAEPDMVIIPWETIKHADSVSMTFYDSEGNIVRDERAERTMDLLLNIARQQESASFGILHFAPGRLSYMTDLAEAYLTDPVEAAKTPLPTGIKGITRFPGEHTIVQFDLPALSHQYRGYYYSPDDVPAAFQNADVPLTETEDGWSWQDAGDNRGTTQRIAECWFRYEADL